MAFQRSKTESHNVNLKRETVDAIGDKTMRILPEIQCENQYSALYKDDAIWQPAVRAIAARHGISGELERLTLGTHVVYGIGEVILKLYCPLWAEFFKMERIALESVDNLPAPTLLAHGKIDGWSYLLQSRVMGVPAQSVWRELPLRVRRDLVGEIGALLRRLHDLPLPEGLDANWASFLQARLDGAEAHHSAQEPWKQLDPIPSRKIRRTPFSPRLPTRRLDGGSLFCSLSAKTVPGSSPGSLTLAMPALVIHSTTSSPYSPTTP